MRLATRGLLSVTGTILVALMFAASASAQGVTVVNEATGADCAPCSVHITGESHITIPSSGLIISSCQDELFVQLHADGTGEVDWVGTAHPGPGCLTVNCLAPGEAHWPITSIAETGPGIERLSMRLCLRGDRLEAHCNVSIPISHPEPHRQTFSVLSLCVGGARRVEANWQTELTPVELVHAAD